MMCDVCCDNESIDYLFLHFPIAIFVWSKLFQVVGLQWVIPETFSSMLMQEFEGFGKVGKG